MVRKGSLISVLAVVSGCGLMAPQGPSGPTSQPTEATYETPKESQDLVKSSTLKTYTQVFDQQDEALAKAETTVLKALKVALGKEAAYPGMPVGESASTALKGLRAAKVKARVEEVTGADGKPVAGGQLLQLKDSFTDRMPVLGRKAQEGKATPAEMKEMQDGAKHVTKLNDLRQQIQALSMATIETNTQVQNISLTQMNTVAGMIRAYKQQSLELGPEEYKLVKRGLEQQKRAEALGATTLAMMAAYQAVINNEKDPKALDIIAEGALKSFPVKVEATDADAKAYVANLGTNVSKAKAMYEATARKAMGDAYYEKNMKAGIDAMFAQAAGAKDTKSGAQIAKDSWNQYKADVEKCKSGIDPAAEGRLGPTCKAVFQAAKSGDTSDLLPGAKKAFDETSNPGAAPGGASSDGEVEGALDTASKLFGEDSHVGASLKGVAALKRGDAKGAIAAALTFVPVPGLKDVFSLASKLF